MNERLAAADRVAMPRTTRRWLAVGVISALVLGVVAVSAPTALAAADTTPPTKPSTPTANPVGFTTATINTGGSTDNVQVAGYILQRQVNGVWTDWNSTLIETTYAYAQPLTPGTTYTIVVVAFDPSGNRSVRSDPVTFTAQAMASPVCRVTRQVLGPQGVLLTYFIDNLTAAAVTNWTATFNMPSTHTTNFVFNSVQTRSADTATHRPAANTVQINPGVTGYFGFHGSRPVGSPLPSGFAFTSPGTGPLTCTVT